MAAKHRNMRILAHRQATMTNELSTFTFPRSRNPFIVVRIVWKYYFPRWRPRWPPKHKNMHILAHRQATMTNELSTFTFSRSRYPFILVRIVCQYHFPRWRPRWPPNYRYMHILAHSQATMTNKLSNFIVRRSENPCVVVGIVCQNHFPRWRPRWRPRWPLSWKVVLTDYSY